MQSVMNRATLLLSRVGDEYGYGLTLGRRQYLKEVAGLGPGPRRREAGVYPVANRQMLIQLFDD
jgi:hypothetical protein